MCRDYFFKTAFILSKHSLVFSGDADTKPGLG